MPGPQQVGISSTIRHQMVRGRAWAAAPGPRSVITPESGRSFELEFESQPPGDWVTGDRVAVKGVLAGRRLQVTEIFRLLGER